MDEFNVSENTQEVAEPVEVIETTETPVEAETVEVADPQPEEKPVQTPEENSRYAAERRERQAKEQEISQKARDSYIAEQGYVWNGQPITTEAEYKQAMREQEIYNKAQQDGKDPNEALWKANMEKRLEENNNQLANYQLREKRYQQDEQLANDPQIGSIYKEWRNDVKSIAEQYNVDLDTAFTILTRERIADLLGTTRIQTEQNTIKGLQQNAQTTPGALGGGGQEPKQDYSKMTSKDFDEIYQKALRGELMKN